MDMVDNASDNKLDGSDGEPDMPPWGRCIRAGVHVCNSAARVGRQQQLEVQGHKRTMMATMSYKKTTTGQLLKQ